MFNCILCTLMSCSLYVFSLVWSRTRRNTPDNTLFSRHEVGECCIIYLCVFNIWKCSAGKNLVQTILRDGHKISKLRPGNSLLHRLHTIVKTHNLVRIGGHDLPAVDSFVFLQAYYIKFHLDFFTWHFINTQYGESAVKRPFIPILLNTGNSCHKFQVLQISQLYFFLD